MRRFTRRKIPASNSCLILGQAAHCSRRLKTATRPIYQTCRKTPGDIRRKIFTCTTGCSCFVFSHFLNIRKTAWEDEKKSVAYSDTSALLTQLKSDAEHLWLKEADSIALQQSLRDLDAAYQNFFKRDRGYTKFKSKRHHRLSYRTTSKSIGVEGKKLRLPKVGAIPFVQSKEFSGRILNATVTRTASGKYFVSLYVEDDLANHLKVNACSSVGLDVDLKEFCITSQGKIIANPKILRGLSRKLARAQRCLSRRKLDSRNRHKQRIFLTRIHERIAQTRLDFLHKLTTQFCRENQTIAVESLNIQGMLKNHHLARAISDASWGELPVKSDVLGMWLSKSAC